MVCRWVVLAGGVEREVAEDFSGGCVDDADVEVVDERDDVGPGELFADADVVESTVVADGDGARFADSVVTDAVVGYMLYRVGDAVASRGIAAAIYEARRVCQLF